VSWFVGTAHGEDRPNVVFFFIDDLGWADVGYHGVRNDVDTPNIDRIASEGAWFSAAYVTAATCGPSRAGLLSGRYQQSFGVEDHFEKALGVPIDQRGIPSDVILLPERFKKIGYRTAKIGKEQTGMHDNFHPLNRGCDFFFGHRGPFRYYLTQEYIDEQFEKHQRGANLWRNRERLSQPQPDRYITEWQADEAVAFIDRNHDQPFYLHMGFKGVHGPLIATEKDLARFSHLGDGEDTLPRRTLLAMLWSVDNAIGRVMERLRVHGLEGNTIVMVASDNGGQTGEFVAEGKSGNASFNTPLRGGKGYYYDGGIRIPFCVRWPKQIAGGRKYDFPVSMLDVAPTLMRAVGGDLDPRFAGIDLLPHLTGQAKIAPKERYLYWRKYSGWAVRDSMWKLVQPLTKDSQPLELYNLQKDPGETRNLIARHPEEARRLKAAWQAWNNNNKDSPLCNRRLPDGFWATVGSETIRDAIKHATMNNE
jgi:arylsulfatase A-like enzyme